MKTLDPTQPQKVQYAIPTWLRDEQIKVNIKAVKGRIEPYYEPRNEPIAIVCFGPSLNDTWEKIKDFKYVMSCSGAHKFLIEKGIIPTWHIEVDPRQHKVTLMGEPNKDVEYLIASTCHPKLLEHLKDFNVKLWHVFDPKDEVILPKGEWMLTGGCGVGVRCITLSRFLGFKDQHIFGMDGSEGISGKHASEHPNQARESMECPYDGVTYKTTPAFLEAARNTFYELNSFKDVTPTFHGEGLVQHMARNWKPERPKGEVLFAFSDQELISPELIELNRKLHTEHLEYGVGGSKYADIAKDLMKRVQGQSLLDYGCGKGYLGKALDFPVWEYDPAIPGKDNLPRAADVVICADVLEHIEPERIDSVIKHIAKCTRKTAFFAIYSGPAKKTYSDGRNTHLIQEKQWWWINKLSHFFDVAKDGIIQLDPILHVLCTPKGKQTVHAPSLPDIHTPVKIGSNGANGNHALVVPEKFDKRSHKFVLEEWVKKNNWTKGVEIGVFHGLTFFHLLEHCPNLHLTGIDIFEPILHKDKQFNEGGRSYKGDKLPEEYIRINREAKKRFPERSKVVKAESAGYAKNIPDHSLDFVFIDGDHLYEAVKLDIVSWLPKVRPGGVICGHDIGMPGVKKAVDEMIQGWTEHKQQVWAKVVPTEKTTKILTCIPFSPDKNLGRAYNKVMESLPEDGWACLLDGDVMFTTGKWHGQLLDAIEREPKGTFVAISNRVGPNGRRNGWQRAKIDPDDHNMKSHRAFGEALAGNKALLDVTEESKMCAGMMILISKKTWAKIGGFADGLRGVDYQMHLSLATSNLKLFCIQGLYVYHWKQGDGKSQVKGTPCADPRRLQNLARKMGRKIVLTSEELA